MKFTTKSAVLAFALTAAAAPVDNNKRQFDSGSLPSLSLPAGTSLPTGTSGLGGTSSGGLGGLGGGSSGGLGGLGGSSSGGLGGLGGSGGLGGFGSSGSTGSLPDLGGSSGTDLGSLSGSGSGLMPSTTFKKRQFGGFGSGSGTTGIGSLTSGSSGTSGFGGFGSSGMSGLSGLGGSTGSSGLSGLTGSTGTTGTSSADTAADSGSSSGGCKAVSLLFARGTGEMGTMGTVIGPPLATALASAIGSDKVYSEGVDYPADAGGNANMGASGGKAMASQAQALLSSCPDTKLVLSGYSQGAMVVHNSLSAQGLDGSKVAAAVMFGDPFNGQALDGVDASKVKEFCGSGDFLCSSGGTTGSGSHMSYGGDAEAAASFIAQAVGV